MTNFLEIALDQISPSPLNPRKNFGGKKLDELAASIKQKGVIEPIIVRTVKDYIRNHRKAPYEIVAGERRYRASIAAGLTEIPAIVRELTDDEAYDYMLVENLQRDDLTEREEAESFKAYIGRHGEEAIGALAEKTGITPGYIRGRAQVLELPAKVLKAWEEGKLAFGHLQQLLRVSRTRKEKFEETVKWLLAVRAGGNYETVRDLAEYIDRGSPALSGAFFDAATLCKSCSANSAIQKSLFGIESRGVLCMNAACFKKHQAEFLDQHWKETGTGKKHGTNGYRFREDIGYNRTHDFWNHLQPPGKKCAACPNFVTIINLAGRVEEERTCAGEQSCFNAVTNPRSAKEKAKGERDPEAPRATWHGEYFRDIFLCKRIPEAMAALDPVSQAARHLLLAVAIHGNRSELRPLIGENSGSTLKKEGKELDGLIKKVIEKVVLSGQHVGPTNWNGFGTAARAIVAGYLGIDVAKEYAVDKDYLEKKTKAEILAFGKKFKIFDQAKKAAATRAKNFHLKTRAIWTDPEKLKKTELVKLILESGVDLVGKVPAEILKGAAK